MSIARTAAASEAPADYNYRRRFDPVHCLQANDAFNKPAHSNTELDRRTAAVGRGE